MTGTWLLLRHYLRRDRWMLVWWALGTTLLYYSQAVSVDGLYTTQAEFDQAAASMESNPAFIAMAGPARALNTIGGQVTWQASAFGAIVAGLMSMFLIGRHTRAEEESGRDELLRAAPIGGLAPTMAAVSISLLANVLLGVLVAGSLISYPLAVPDSIALGVGLTLCGWVFTGTALLAAQLTSSTRSMYGIAGAIIALAYVLRAVGDVGNSVFSWLSPIGWYQGMHAFSGVRWWPALLLVLAFAINCAAAYGLFVRRDFGSGVFASRPGPATAGRGLQSGLGLAWRLQRGAILGWSLGLLFLGVAYGSIGNDVGDLVGDSNLSKDLLVQSSGDIVDGFYATAILMLALIGSGFAISSALRPRAEEDDSRVESLLATALPRRTWLLGHVVMTVLGVALVVFSAGLGLGLGYALVTGDQSAIVNYTLATVGYLAPVLVLSAIARVLYGVLPAWTSLAWVALVFCVVVMFFGQLFGFPQWLMDLSPFEHLALVPAESFAWVPFVALLVVAAVLSALGQLGFARRDVR